VPVGQSLQKPQYLFIPIIADLLFHSSHSGAFLLLPDLMNKHLSSFSLFLNQPVNNTILHETFMTNFKYPFAFRKIIKTELLYPSSAGLMYQYLL